MKKLLLKPFYLLLKRDMVNRLSEKHGEQFIDDVMETFDMPTNLMQSYYETAENLGVQETVMQTYDDKPVSDIKWTRYKIIVPTEADRQELMAALIETSLEAKRPTPPLSPRIKEGVLGTCPRCRSSEVKAYNHLFGPSIGCIHPDCQNYYKRTK